MTEVCKNCRCYSDDGRCEAFGCQIFPNAKGCYGFIPKEPKEG